MHINLKPDEQPAYRRYYPIANTHKDTFKKELSGLPKKTRLEWIPERDAAFDQMKAIVAHDVLLAYPNHNKPFEIYTDASNYQLGAVIIQGGWPVAYYSRKFNPAQRNYTTIEKSYWRLWKISKNIVLCYWVPTLLFSPTINILLTKFQHSACHAMEVLCWGILAQDQIFQRKA